MQKAYISKLYELMQRDKNVLSLLSDSGTDYDIMMARDMPLQCYNFGISEQNKVAAASGLAAMGKIPFVYTTSAFIAYRAYEFLRNDICFQNRNVKLVGMGSGISCWSTLGASHHTSEDIALLDSIPGLILLSATTPKELTQMIEFAYTHQGPVYIRMGMSNEPEIYDESYEFEFNKINQVLKGERTAVFSTGTITSQALEACKSANASLYSVPTLKPFNKEHFLKISENYEKIATVEEHQINSGLGSIISNCLANVQQIGLDNKFAVGYGKGIDVLKANNLDSESIYKLLEE